MASPTLAGTDGAMDLFFDQQLESGNLEQLSEERAERARIAGLVASHVLSPAAAPVSAASYGCVRLCVLPWYLDASVQ